MVLSPGTRGLPPRWWRPKQQLEAAVTSAARKPRALHPGLGAAKREPLGSTGSTAGLLPSIVVRHMGDGNPLVVIGGQEEQEEQEVQEL